MQIRIHCITLRIVRHSDSTSIATFWSRELGRVSAPISAGNSREARRRRALMMPLSMFEGVATCRQGSEMVRLSDITPLRGAPAATTSAVKSIISAFLADFLYAVLRENQPDTLLTDFIIDAVRELASASGAALANFHLSFIFRLTQYLGIAPDMGSYEPGRYFDMREGRFTTTAPTHADYVASEHTQLLWALSRAHGRGLALLRLNHEQRNAILDRMLQYYSMHHAPVTSLASLQIVRDIMR